MAFLAGLGFLMLIGWTNENSVRELWERFPLGVWVVVGLFIFFCYCMAIAVKNAPTEEDQ